MDGRQTVTREESSSTAFRKFASWAFDILLAAAVAAVVVGLVAPWLFADATLVADEPGKGHHRPEFGLIAMLLIARYGSRVYAAVVCALFGLTLALLRRGRAIARGGAAAFVLVLSLMYVSAIPAPEAMPAFSLAAAPSWVRKPLLQSGVRQTFVDFSGDAHAGLDIVNRHGRSVSVTVYSLLPMHDHGRVVAEKMCAWPGSPMKLAAGAAYRFVPGQCDADPAQVLGYQLEVRDPQDNHSLYATMRRTAQP